MAELDHLLNREVEEFRGEFKKLLILETANSAYEAYRELPSYSDLRDRLDDYIKTVTAHNAAIQAKIDNPFEPMEYDADVIAVLKGTPNGNFALIRPTYRESLWLCPPAQKRRRRRIRG